jgi:uncharacterized protein
MEFEWETRKAESNERKHGVSFTEAAEAFYDPNAIELFDDLNSDVEIRFRLLAFSPKRLLFVGFTIRDGEKIRIITARKATLVEKRYYYDEQR